MLNLTYLPISQTQVIFPPLSTVRQYEPIWNRLKSLPLEEASKKGVSLTANRRLHPRIVKAVVKEKWLDIPFKIETDPKKLILWHHSRGAIITFYLQLSSASINQYTV